MYPRYASARLGEIIVFSTFFFGVAICFFLSASYVLFPLEVPPFGTDSDMAQLPYYREP